jgi:hypothetical protein
VSGLVNQSIQLAGSALILVAFIGAQAGRLDQKSRAYLLVNALGSTALAVDAAYGRQGGFLLLEGSWAIVSGIGMLSAALPTRRDPARPGQADGQGPGDVADESLH